MPPVVAADLSRPRNTQVELERRADELLGRCVKLGSASGIYSRAALERKMRDERKRLPALDEGGISERTLEYLIERQLDDLVDAAGLTAIEEIVYRLRVAGFSSKRMAAALGITRTTIYRRLRSVKRKVTAAYEQGRYAGWYEVYLSEVNRPAYKGRKALVG